MKVFFQRYQRYTFQSVQVISYLSADLVAALAGLNVYNFTHFCCGFLKRALQYKLQTLPPRRHTRHEWVSLRLSATLCQFLVGGAMSRSQQQVPAQTVFIRVIINGALIRRKSSSVG